MAELETLQRLRLTKDSLSTQYAKMIEEDLA